jgi:predicted PurR-regulated permease PerM
VPVLLVSGRIIEAAGGGAVTVKDKIGSGEWRQVIENNELLVPLSRWTAHIDFHKVSESVTAWLASTSAAFVSGSVLSVITLIVTLYLLFYFLRDREVALNWLREMSPLSGSEMDLLFDRVADTVRATLYGTVVVAVVQGALGGLMFWWLGLPMPVFWGVVMGLLAIVPMLGAFVVWVPAAVYLALSGDWGSTLILTVWGTIVVGGIDNLLYPILVKDQLSLHTVPAFISIIGGLVLFGASGLLLGPIILTLTIFFLELWRD